MKRLAELQSRQQAITDRQKAILAAAESATAGELTEEQRTEFDSLDTEYAKNETDIATLAKDAERASRLASRVPTRVTLPTQTARTDAGSPQPAASVSVKGEGFEKDPKRGFSDHREFLTLVMAAGQTGRVEDPRLKFMTAGSDEQSTVSDPYGGFLIPAGFAPSALKVMAESDPLGALTNKVPMATPQVSFNARVDKNHSTSVSGGFVVYRRAETQAVSSSRQQYEQVVLNANSLMGLAYASEEVLARSPISFIALIEDGMRDEFPAKLFNERLNGTGVGQFEGVMNSPALIDVAKESGQAASTIVFENILKMSARCWGYGNSVWVANHNCRVQLRSLTQAIGTAGVAVPLFTNQDGVERLDGRPIYFTEFAQTLGTSGDLMLLNLSQYLEGTLTNMQQAESMHVRFENHERTFKFWMENDGRGWWRTALTPKNGSTLSPFISLATRA